MGAEGVVLPFLQKPATFSVVLTLTGCLYSYLFWLLLTGPAGFLGSVGVASNPAAEFLARRASMLMLGFAVLSLLALKRHATPAGQLALAAVGVNMAGFALMSIREVLRGFANAELLKPAAVETVLALACAALWFAGRRLTRRA